MAVLICVCVLVCDGAKPVLRDRERGIKRNSYITVFSEGEGSKTLYFDTSTKSIFQATVLACTRYLVLISVWEQSHRFQAASTANRQYIIYIYLSPKNFSWYEWPTEINEWLSLEIQETWKTHSIDPFDLLPSCVTSLMHFNCVRKSVLGKHYLIFEVFLPILIISCGT